MRAPTLLKAWIIIYVALLVLSASVLMARAPILTLNDVTIAEQDGCALIQVKFNFPLRYVKHFPYESGDDLRIQFDPIPIAVPPGEGSALFTRESVRPPRNDIASLIDVIYEGNVEGGPFLTLYFSRPVVFRVKQGADFRSLNIVILGPEASECSRTP